MPKKAKSGGKICPEGKAWARRTFDTYPSAYANMAASKYCKDPTTPRSLRVLNVKEHNVTASTMEKAELGKDWN